MKNSNGFVTLVMDSFELVTWHKYVDAFVTRVMVTTEFVTRIENSLYVRQIGFNLSHVKWQIRTYSQTLPRVRIGQKCTDSFEIEMQIHHPIPRIASANLYARQFMLAQEELVLFWHFNEVFNACFVCLFCLVNYKIVLWITRKKKKKRKTKTQLWIHIIP